MRFGFIRTEKATYPVRVLCRTLLVSTSGFYAWCRRGLSRRAQEDAALKVEIRAAHAASGKTYGSPRVHEDLKADGQQVGRKRVARLMQEEGLEGQRKRRFRVTTDSRHSHPVAANELNRNFTASAPNKVWVTDITYIWTREGWMYLAAILDLFSRRVVGWSMDSYLDRTLALDALGMALRTRRPEAGLIHHSDRGVQYASKEYRSQLREARNRLQHEPQGRLLGQRRRGELLLDPQGGTRPSKRLRQPQPGPRFGLRIHRSLLQRSSPAFRPRLRQPRRA